MFRILKNLSAWLWRQKKLVFLLISLTTFLFFIRFPWNTFIEKNLRDLQKQYPLALKTDFERLSVKILPPGVRFEKPIFNYQDRSLDLDSLILSMDIPRWLALTPAWRVQALDEDSYLTFVFWKKEKNFQEESGEERPLTFYFVKGHSSSLDLKLFSAFWPNTHFSGSVRSYFKYEGSFEDASSIVASLNFQGEDLNLTKTNLQTPMGPLSLPSLKWKEGEILLSIKEGELVLKNIRLGTPSDSFIVRMKGSGALFGYNGRFRLNSYNIELQMDVAKDFKMSLLDLMFAGFKEEKETFYRYSLRMTGRGGEVPNMEKLEEFEE